MESRLLQLVLVLRNSSKLEGEKKGCGGEVEIPAKKQPKVFTHSIEIRANKRTDKPKPF